ncbi:MAG: DM13 domain-containing protein [Anaerolineales bacterium]
MSKKRLIILGIAGLAVGLPVAWYLLSPLLINRVVDEQLPFVPAEATDAMEEAMAEPAKIMEDPMPAGEAAEMRILAQGEFYNLAHDGHGTATIYQLADGGRVLRFEDFEVLNGPELVVWLVPVDPVPDTVGVEIAGYIDLGPLKGNIGDQNYNLPADLDLNDFKSVVIWCRPFRVPFNAAPLIAP